MDIQWPAQGVPAVKRIALIAEYEDGTAVAFTADKPVLPQLKIEEPERSLGLGPTDLGFAPQMTAIMPVVARVTIGFDRDPREGIKFRALSASDVAGTFSVVAPEAPES